MTPTTSVAVAIGLLVALGGAYLGADHVYLAPAAEKRERAAELESSIERYREVLLRGGNPKNDWQAIAETTIASTDQDAAHRIRDLAYRIASDAGLEEVVVNHGRPTRPSNPAIERKSKVAKRLRDALEDREDFRVLRGTVRATGTLEQLAVAAATFSAQPWAHRIEALRVEPANRGRTTFNLTLAFATLYAVDTRPTAPPALVQPDPAKVESLLEIARRNPFVAPEPPPPPPPARVEPGPVKQAAPAPPAPPPFDKWRIVGIAESRGSEGRTEVFLRRTDTNQTRMLTPGKAILGLTLEGVRDDAAIFRERGQTLIVEMGQSLADRRADG